MHSLGVTAAAQQQTNLNYSFFFFLNLSSVKGNTTHTTLQHASHDRLQIG